MSIRKVIGFLGGPKVHCEVIVKCVFTRIQIQKVKPLKGEGANSLLG